MAWVDQMEAWRNLPAAREVAMVHLLMGVAPVS